MSVLRDILRVLNDCISRQPGFRPQEYTLVLLPTTYERLLTESWTAAERLLVTQTAPDQLIRILDVPVVLGEPHEDWGWMLQWRRGGTVPGEEEA